MAIGSENKAMIHPEIPTPFELPELGRFYGFLIRIGGRIGLRPIGRNDQCPCGSGVKLKKCCREFDGRYYVRVMNAINDFTLTPCEECHIKSGLLLRQ